MARRTAGAHGGAGRLQGWKARHRRDDPRNTVFSTKMKLPSRKLPLAAVRVSSDLGSLGRASHSRWSPARWELPGSEDDLLRLTNQPCKHAEYRVQSTRGRNAS